MIATAPSPALANARAQFGAVPGYLSACTLGLPTRDTLDALRRDTEEWATGTASASRYTELVERVRADYARLVRVEPGRAAIGSQTSAMVSVIAASVPAGAEVLCVDGDFSSVVFPFLAQASRGVRVRHVRLEELASAVTDATWLVAFSLVQSATGRIADADGIRAAAAAHGARTLCDTTQAAGWMPVDAASFDATVCHGYKWLCSPRGAAFLTVSEDFAAGLVPTQAGWYAGDDPWASCYGPAMTLAADARRFDVSPAWPAWVGAEPAIRMFASLDAAEVRDRVVALGDAFSAGLGLDTRGQAIITWPDADGRDLANLSAAGVTASGRAGRARVAFHLWNDEEDVDMALAALRR